MPVRKFTVEIDESTSEDRVSEENETDEKPHSFDYEIARNQDGCKAEWSQG